MKRFILHPLVFPLLPVFAFFINNLPMLPWYHLIRPVVFLEVLGGLLWWGLARWFRDAAAAAVVVSLVLVSFFAGGQVDHSSPLVRWIILAAVCVAVGRVKPAWLARLSPVLNAMAVIMLLLQFFQFAMAMRPAPFARVPFEVPVNAAPARTNLPHVVHIVLDGFGRPDFLQRQFSVDVEPFGRFLQSNGFFIAEAARANYLITAQSMGSELSLRYLPGSASRDAAVPALSYPQLVHLAGNSVVRRVFEKLGYRCRTDICAGDVLTEWNDPEAWTLYSATLSFVERRLLKKSCLAFWVYRKRGRDDQAQHARLYRHYLRTRDMFADMADCVRAPDPVYRIFHVVSPHPPFVFMADGQYREGGASTDYVFTEGPAAGPSGNPWKIYRDGYAEQVQYVTRQVSTVIGRMLRESSRPLVIIVQGDHGPGMEFDWAGSGYDSNLDGRSAIFMAVRLPSGVKPLPAEFQSPVNLYRYLFNELFGAGLPLLPAQIFYSPWGWAKNFTEVTGRVMGRDRFVTYTEKVDYQNLIMFLRATACTWRESVRDGMNVIRDVVRTVPDPVPMPCGSVGGSRDGAAVQAVVDGDIHTAWTMSLRSGESARVRFDFPGLRPVCGVRLTSLDRAYPAVSSIKVVADAGVECVVTNWQATPFFWSGTNVYQRDVKCEQDILFAPRMARAVELELVRNAAAVVLNEAECLTPASGPLPRDDAELLYQAVVRLGGRNVCAPRWFEQYGYEKSGRRWTVPLPVATLRHGPLLYWDDMAMDGAVIDLTPDTVIVVRLAAVDRSLAALKRAGVEPHVQVAGSHALLWFDGRNWQDDFRYCGKLYAFESGVRYGSQDRKAKQIARVYFEKAAQQPGQAIPFLKKCLDAYPDYQVAWRSLAEACRRAGDAPAAQEARRQWRARTEPPIRCGASFAQGVKFLGCEMSTNRLAAGAQGAMVCYWQVPPGLKTDQLAVFLHFRQDKRQFQGDRVLLENYPAHVTADQPFPEVFRQEMSFTVPKDFPGGSYDIYVGLCDRGTGMRLKVKSEYAARKRCVKVPASLAVVQE